MLTQPADHLNPDGAGRSKRGILGFCGLPKRSTLCEGGVTAFHNEWRGWYRSPRKFRASYEHLHLAVIEDQTGWAGRLWDATNNRLVHLADPLHGLEDAKAMLLRLARSCLTKDFSSRVLPAEVQRADSSDPNSNDPTDFSECEL